MGQGRIIEALARALANVSKAIGRNSAKIKTFELISQRAQALRVAPLRAPRINRSVELLTKLGKDLQGERALIRAAYADAWEMSQVRFVEEIEKRSAVPTELVDDMMKVHVESVSEGTRALQEAGEAIGQAQGRLNTIDLIGPGNDPDSLARIVEAAGLEVSATETFVGNLERPLALIPKMSDSQVMREVNIATRAGIPGSLRNYLADLGVASNDSSRILEFARAQATTNAAIKRFVSLPTVTIGLTSALAARSELAKPADTKEKR